MVLCLVLIKESNIRVFVMPSGLMGRLKFLVLPPFIPLYSHNIFIYSNFSTSGVFVPPPLDICLSCFFLPLISKLNSRAILANYRQIHLSNKNCNVIIPWHFEMLIERIELNRSGCEGCLLFGFTFKCYEMVFGDLFDDNFLWS